jgi:hypothetical protein
MMPIPLIPIPDNVETEIRRLLFGGQKWLEQTLARWRLAMRNDDKLIHVSLSLLNADALFDPKSPVSRSDWAQIVQRFEDCADRIARKWEKPVSRPEIIAYLIHYTQKGEAPESVAEGFETYSFPGLWKSDLIRLTLGNLQLSDPFTPLTLVEYQDRSTLLFRNTVGYWFLALDDLYPRETIMRYGLAHRAAVNRMLELRDGWYGHSGFNNDGITTQPRPPELAKLEMVDIIESGLDPNEVACMMPWFIALESVDQAMRLGRLWKDPELAARTASNMLKLRRRRTGNNAPLIPLLHNETEPVACFHGEPIYFWHGICVPPWLVNTPGEHIDPKTVLRCRNPAVRDLIAQKATKADRGHFYEILATKVLEEAGEYSLRIVELPDMNVVVLRIADRHSNANRVWWRQYPSHLRTLAEVIDYRNHGLGNPIRIT